MSGRCLFFYMELIILGESEQVYCAVEIAVYVKLARLVCVGSVVELTAALLCNPVGTKYGFGILVSEAHIVTVELYAKAATRR